MQLGESNMINNYSVLLDYIEYFNGENNEFYKIYEGKETNEENMLSIDDIIGRLREEFYEIYPYFLLFHK